MKSTARKEHFVLTLGNMPSPTYVTFPNEVISNTHDFEVRWVIHNQRQMLGVFARRAITETECSLFIGVYSGLPKTQQEVQDKIVRYAERHSIEKKTAAAKVNAYSLRRRHYDPDHILDPTDEDGNLLLEFKPYITCYVNEPPPGCSANAAFVHNRPRRRYEYWLIEPIGQDQEVFIRYGENYLRDYPINRQAANGRHSYFIAEGISFELDRRGAPAPLCLPAYLPGDSIPMN